MGKVTTMNEKKLRKSPIVIALYVLAVLTLVYACYQAGSAIKYVISYYSSYSMTPGFAETATYVLQTAFQPIVMAILLAAAGFILNEVRALNPAYYATKEEIEAAKAAKAAKKAAKKAETEEVTEEAADEDAPKLTVSIEEVEAEPTVVFESVEATAPTEEEVALQKAEEDL